MPNCMGTLLAVRRGERPYSGARGRVKVRSVASGEAGMYNGARHVEPRGEALMARGPGPGAAAHRLLIPRRVPCALRYAAWEGREYVRTGEGAAVLRSAAAGLVAGAIAFYLRRLRSLGARLTPPDRPVDRPGA